MSKQSLQPALFSCDENGMGSSFYAHFSKGIFGMKFDGAFANKQFLRDFTITQAPSQQLKYLLLSL